MKIEAQSLLIHKLDLINVDDYSIWPPRLQVYFEAKDKGTEAEAGGQPDEGEDKVLEWKLMSCSQCKELGHLVDLASDCFLTLVQPIRSQQAC